MSQRAFICKEKKSNGDMCDHSTDDKQSFNKHLKEKHNFNVEVAECPRCKKTFANKTYLKRHQEEVCKGEKDEKERWNCSQCTGMSSTSVSTYAYHMFLKHNKEGISEVDLIKKYLTCQGCNSKYTQANSLCAQLRNTKNWGKNINMILQHFMKLKE